MHFSSPKMVCETKIVADEHDAIPGTKKESIMWSSPPPLSGAALPDPAGDKDARRDAVFIREFERGDQEEVRRIFYEGIMERIPNTAFRGLRQQPKTQFLYALLTGARYYYSRKVIQSYLDCALHTDMADIEAYYMTPTVFFSVCHQCLMLLFLGGGARWMRGGDCGDAQGREDDNTVELRRMSVDSRYRGKGIASQGRHWVVASWSSPCAGCLTTTPPCRGPRHDTAAVKLAAHKLYESLGFRRTGQSEDYRLPGMSRSPLERLFFQIRYSRYRLQLREE
ncbi:hypothetical protein L3Q82_004030 [Scortum barcoo]|uniref:Uncharacterized protein n=1 Tax=Scortum barcoo TaxID=214431 RepID=A0ACB8X9Y4_9TELE|nr:hypothetical protein L3Q82_004030 [Scortum barcoo]